MDGQLSAKETDGTERDDAQIIDGKSEGFVERRFCAERRENVVDRRLSLNRQRGPGKRRSVERRAAEEGQLTDEQFEFLMAVEEYKRINMRPFPTWTEVLELIKAMGYRKVAEPQALGPVEEEEQAAGMAK